MFSRRSGIKVASSTKTGKHTIKKSIITSCVAAALLSTTAFAHQAGDIIVRGGLTTVAPDESTSNIVVGGGDLGVDLAIDNNTQLGLNLAYFITDQINIELLAATPFKHDVDFGVVDQWRICDLIQNRQVLSVLKGSLCCGFGLLRIHFWPERMDAVRKGRNL